MPRMASLYRRFADLIPELAKFGVVGLIGTIIDLGGADYLHVHLGLGPMVSKALSITAATIFTYLGSRFWTFRHRVNQPVLREGILFAVLNLVGLGIAEVVIAVTTYGLDLKSELAYNAASVVGTGLGTIFRYFSYKKWVFLADAPGTAVAAGEAAVSGIVDPAEVSASGAMLAGASGSYGPPWEQAPREQAPGEHAPREQRRARNGGYGPPWDDLERPGDPGYGPPSEHLDPGYGPPSEHLDPADSDASRR
jgi:putative flippase GtrA